MAALPETSRNLYRWVIGRFAPSALQPKLLIIADRFLEGLSSLANLKDILMVFVTSVVIWLLETVKYWFVMYAFSFVVSFFALMLMNGVVNLATTLPSAPGYIGTFDGPGIEVLKVFGVDPVHRKRRLSRFLGPLMSYVHSNGVVVGAFVQGQMIGVVGMIKPGYCRPRLGDRLFIAGSILTSAPPTILLRIYIWLANWARNDPDEPHWHIGPLAVLPENRQSGVGRHLMLFCCQKLDFLEATAWLETDLMIEV